MTKIPPDKYEEIKFTLVYKLAKRRCYDGIYTPIERLLKSIPPHDRGYGWAVIDDLKKTCWMELHKNNTCISLSLAYRKEIQEYIDKNRDRW